MVDVLLSCRRSDEIPLRTDIHVNVCMYHNYFLSLAGVRVFKGGRACEFIARVVGLESLLPQKCGIIMLA